MREVIKKKIYNTETAKMVSCTGILNKNRCTRSTELYLTKKGNYFLAFYTMWQGEKGGIEPIERTEAEEFYERSYYQELNYNEAFPGTIIEEA